MKERLKVVDIETAIGTTLAVLAFMAWGILPLYWKLLYQVPAIEILAHRILWSFVFVFLIIIFTKSRHKIKAVLADKKQLFFLFLASLLLSVNWFTYIWAVNADFVVEASMGYYMLPLVTVLLALIVLKEKLNFWQWVSLCLAFIGVLVIVTQYGRIPWIAFILAGTFSLYGLAKKMLKMDSLVALMLETAFIVPAALLFIVIKQTQGAGSFGTISISITLLLIGAGIATATPLLWFAGAARRIKLSTIGFLEYIAPSITLYLGVFVFNEPFTKAHLLSFGFIWLGLIIYYFSNSFFLKNIEPAALKRRFFNNF